MSDRRIFDIAQLLIAAINSGLSLMTGEAIRIQKLEEKAARHFSKAKRPTAEALAADRLSGSSGRRKPDSLHPNTARKEQFNGNEYQHNCN